MCNRYSVADAIVASDFVVQQLSPAKGRKIKINYCHCKVINATIAGVCNDFARNLTVTQNEARRDILVKGCGLDSVSAHFS